MSLISVLRFIVLVEIGFMVILILIAMSAGPQRRFTDRRSRKAVEQFERGQGEKLSHKRALGVLTEVRRRMKWIKGDEREPLADQLAGAGIIDKVIELLAHKRASVRAEAAQAIPLLATKEVLTALAPLLDDADSDVRMSAVSAIAEAFGNVPRLAETDEGHAVLSRMTMLLDEPHKIPRTQLATLLAELGTIASPVVIDSLYRLKSEGRASAASVIGAIKDPSAFAPLMDLLGDPSIDVRSRASAALGVLGDKRAARNLIELLKDKAWPVRGQAAKALGALRDVSATQPLANSLTDRAWWVRVNAAAALQLLGPSGVTALRDALRSPDAYARERAAAQLEDSGEVTVWIDQLTAGVGETRGLIEDLVAAGGVMRVAEAVGTVSPDPELLAAWNRGLRRLSDAAGRGDAWAESVLRRASIGPGESLSGGR